jgi:enoyl-CoA hydratase/carnithine racemase
MAKLFTYAKPTIMVNGFCFGGGFTQLIACDFAITDGRRIQSVGSQLGRSARRVRQQSAGRGAGDAGCRRFAATGRPSTAASLSVRGSQSRAPQQLRRQPLRRAVVRSIRPCTRLAG